MIDKKETRCKRTALIIVINYYSKKVQFAVDGQISNPTKKTKHKVEIAFIVMPDISR